MNTELAYHNCMRNVNFQENFDYLLNNNSLCNLFNIVVYSENISYSNIKKFEEKLLSKNHLSLFERIYFSTEFASKIDIADIKAHQNYVVDFGDLKDIYKFAKSVEKSDKQLLSQIVLESLDEHWIYKFYNNVEFDKTKYDSYFKNLVFL